MIYIFQLPGMLVSAVCSIFAAICGGACKCSGELFKSIPEACSCVTNGLMGVRELVRRYTGSAICFKGTLRWGLMLSCFVNGAVIWNAMRSMDSKLVKECTEASSIGTMPWLIKSDLVLAICHVVFVLYLNLMIEAKQLEVEQEHPELRRSQVLKKSVALLIQYDIAVCLYFFLWVYSFYQNCVGVGLVSECENLVKSHETWPKMAVSLLIAYGPLTVMYGFCLQGYLFCCSAKESIGGGKRRNVQAREGTASYLPLAAGEPPRGAAAPQV